MDIASLYSRAFPTRLGRILAPLGLVGAAWTVEPGLAAAHAQYARARAVYLYAATHHAAGALRMPASPTGTYIATALPAVAAAIVIIYLCSRAPAAGRHLVRASILPPGEEPGEGEPRPSAIVRAYPSRARRVGMVIWTGLVSLDLAASIHVIGAGLGTQLLAAQMAVIWLAGAILLAAGWHPAEPGAEPRSWLRVREDRR